MPRPEKVQAVAEIKERLEEAHAVFLAEYAGLSVKDQQALRRELRANDAEFKVVKMTLARRAADGLDIAEFDELLIGPTGIAFADGDPVGAAKALKEFAKTHEVFTIKGGLLGSDFLTAERISELADIEPREVLLAKLAGAMKAPMANLAGLLAALPRNTASVLKQLLEKKEAGAVVAAAEEIVAEAAAEAVAEAAVAEADDAVDAAAEVVVDEETVEDVTDEPETEETETDSEATVEASDDAVDATDDDDDEASADAEEK